MILKRGNFTQFFYIKNNLGMGQAFLGLQVPLTKRMLSDLLFRHTQHIQPMYEGHACTAAAFLLKRRPTIFALTTPQGIVIKGIPSFPWTGAHRHLLEFRSWHITACVESASGQHAQTFYKTSYFMDIDKIRFKLLLVVTVFNDMYYSARCEACCSQTRSLGREQPVWCNEQDLRFGLERARFNPANSHKTH